MKHCRVRTFAVLLLVFALAAPASVSAQVTRADYERATGLRAKLQPLALDIVDRGGWIGKSARYWYRKSVAGGNEYWIADASSLEKAIAFDHAKLAAALAAASGEKVEALNLPFFTLTFGEDGKSVQFAAAGARWTCDLSTYACKKLEGPGPRGPRGGGMTMWERGPAPEAASREAKTSPDGKWEAFIRNYNVCLRDKDKKDETVLSRDGSEGNYYTYESLSWSPDSKKLVATACDAAITARSSTSSPRRPTSSSRSTTRWSTPSPATPWTSSGPFSSSSTTRRVSRSMTRSSPTPTSSPIWPGARTAGPSPSSTTSAATRSTGSSRSTARPEPARAVVEEKAETFFCYSDKKYRFDIADGREVVWMSERDGWNHLYLYDGATGAVKNQITRGEWVVRSVDKVDEEKRQIYFQASGVLPGQDPYFIHAFRVNLDGTGLVRLTEGDGNHSVAYSPDHAYFVDTWSRVDIPPTTEIRRVADKALVMAVEKGDIGGLLKSGWRTPEVFVAKARDGKTDIWGIIIRPTNFDPRKKYPVIEYIYAGPQGSFVPKSFQAYSGMRALAELGFIVSQCDGLGTSNRSKAFHDYCFKNLGDAGFPDRILWHRAVAARYAYYDIGRVGIYGNSAGGQNALGGLLFHPEFYKAGVASCGCHDNRMDKMWWNEQWMGWPLGPEYAASSNVDNAAKLQGQLLLIVGEMDTNVDPASTMQVVNALIKADKVFDLLVIPGAGHGMGGAYGERKMYDFFVRALLGATPPNWNGAQ